MNGNCAGGTGAFIDQMATLLHTDAEGLNALAEKSDTLYPIAARCGVFAKTDVQALMIEEEGGEIIASGLADFVLYGLLDSQFRHRYLSGSWLSATASKVLVRLLEWYRKPYQEAVMALAPTRACCRANSLPAAAAKSGVWAAIPVPMHISGWLVRIAWLTLPTSVDPLA